MTMLSSTREAWYAAFRSSAKEAAPATAPLRLPPCVHEAVAAAIGAHPERALLVDEAFHLTNRDLLRAVDARARMLLARCNGAGAVVAVKLDSGIELVVTYFACLRAALRYLPLPAGPDEMISRLLPSIRPQLLVTTAARRLAVPGVATIAVDAPTAAEPRDDVPLPAPEARRPAHVLLTSGTATGSPKAVITDHVGSMLSHRWRAALWPYDSTRDVVGCNIFGIWDLVPALLAGVPVVMLRDATLRDPAALAEAIVRYGITRLMITPTLLDACLESTHALAAFERLRLLVLCGENVTASLMTRSWERLRGVSIANLYSLSECHDVAAGMLIPGATLSVGGIAPFADVHVVQPDDRQTLVPVGQPGRILVGGRALAAGYLDQEATAERFVNFSPGAGAEPARVYDTGDLGSLERDGTLVILGRIETELKVRGAWADPDAVSALLLQHPWVARAVTVAQADAGGHTALRAFVVPARSAPADLEEALRNQLRRQLPPQNVPGSIELVDDLPLLPSGKIDISRLVQKRGEAAAAAATAAAADAAHGADLRDAVLTVFREVLGRPAATIDDSFDALGGDSLGAIVLCGRIQAATGRLLRVRDLQRHPTPAGVVRFLTQHPSRNAPEQAPLPLDRLPVSAPRPARALETVFVTGATGALGTTLLRRLLEDPSLHVIALLHADDDHHAHLRLESTLPDDTPLDNVTAIAGDLTRPRLGMPVDVFAAIGKRVDAVLHLGARLDMFAGYEALAAVNVAGTRMALELALAAGATFHHLSSSSVLPLDAEESWDESSHGRRMLEALAPRLVRSDGYSQTKLAAEALVWQAAERGLDVVVTRVPHLVGGGRGSRLGATLAALCTLGYLPESPWHWQLAAVDTVCDVLLERLHGDVAAPLVHVAPRPLTDRDIETALLRHGHRLERLTLPALANVIVEAGRAAAGATHPGAAGERESAAQLAALAQLVGEHGVRAALCLGEALLVSRRGGETDAARLLIDLLPD